MLLSCALVASFAGLVSSAPHAAVKRQVTQLRSEYDFIVAGGGTSGLTVADRLSEAFPDKTVLVVEYGDVEYAPGIFDPPLAVWGGVGASASYFIVQSQPAPDIKNKTAFVLAGKVVGGSSAINGMFFDRPSRYDMDAWASASHGQLESVQNRWDWNALYPFFKKSVTFTPPPAAAVAKYNYTWDMSAYGGTTPIHSSFPAFLWADHHTVRNAWKDLGVPTFQECAGGDKDGLCWIPISQHPVTARRSHAGVGHYSLIKTCQPRNNYDLLVKHQVTRVLYPNGPLSGPPVVEVKPVDGGALFNITATAEVIISAGVFHTPTILQRSGIGGSSFLTAAGIPTVVDLPGVGSNFQDHSGSAVSWSYTTPGNFTPLPSALANPAFLADATAGFDEIPARGPYTVAGSNSAIFVPLANITSNYQAIINKIKDSITDGTAASFLPADYRTDPTMIAGYESQLAIIAKLLAHPRVPSLETTFATGTSGRAVHLHPLSRGTVRINTASPLDGPIVNYGSGSNPIDFDLYRAHSRYLRNIVNTPALQQFGAVELTPGVSANSDATLDNYIKDGFVFSFMHPCCTASMLPKNKGGVIGTNLKVHGAAGLRVVDMSILPFLPSSHLSALAYAVGEKAADMIIHDWSA